MVSDTDTPKRFVRGTETTGKSSLQTTHTGSGEKVQDTTGHGKRVCIINEEINNDRKEKKALEDFLDTQTRSKLLSRRLSPEEK